MNHKGRVMRPTIEQVMKNFAQFWAAFFPEMNEMSREEALAFAGDAQNGMFNTAPDNDMVPYQDRVAKVYGAYEAMQFQLLTLVHLATNIQVTSKAHIVSLGSGPGSYELWTLRSAAGLTATLVDHSPEMLARARQIADKLGIGDRIETLVADAANSGVADASADMVLCINAMHWSTGWRMWIREIARVAKPGAAVFLTCSLGHPRSQITVEELATSLAEYGLVPVNYDFISPPTEGPGGMVMTSSRFFVVAQKR